MKPALRQPLSLGLRSEFWKLRLRCLLLSNFFACHATVISKNGFDDSHRCVASSRWWPPSFWIVCYVLRKERCSTRNRASIHCIICKNFLRCIVDLGWVLTAFNFLWASADHLAIYDPRHFDLSCWNVITCKQSNKRRQKHKTLSGSFVFKWHNN